MYDVIVIGAGIIGSATAYNLAQRGQRVLVLERYALPHSRGSSHGQSRVLQIANTAHHHSIMARDAALLWEQLENEVNTKILSNKDTLAIQRTPCEDPTLFDGVVQNAGKTATLMNGEEVNQMYSGLLSLPPECKAAIVKDKGGIIRPNKALQSYHDLIIRNGGTLKDTEAVLKIQPGSDVIVKTTEAEYKCQHVVIACGPWVTKMLEPLGLSIPTEVQKVEVCYWREKQAGMYSDFPDLHDYTESSCLFYAISSFEYHGMAKVSCSVGVPCDPDERDVIEGEGDSMIPRIKSYTMKYLPGLVAEKPCIRETCLYTKSPDNEYIIDYHPDYPNIVFAGGMSGFGFMLAPVTGQIVADLAMGMTPKYDISMMSLSRFKSGIEGGSAN